MEATMQETAPLSRLPDFSVRHDASLLGEMDYHLFNEGSHFRLHEKLGAHRGVVDGQAGAFFGVWAPNAERVCVMGDFNGWDKWSHPLHSRGQSGIWEGFITDMTPGQIYKYNIQSRYHGYRVDKADPIGFACETPSKTGSIVWDLDYPWADKDWMEIRKERNGFDAPISIYELHLGSWRRIPEQGNRSLTYREMAPALI